MRNLVLYQPFLPLQIRLLFFDFFRIKFFDGLLRFRLNLLSLFGQACVEFFLLITIKSCIFRKFLLFLWLRNSLTHTTKHTPRTLLSWAPKHVDFLCCFFLFIQWECSRIFCARFCSWTRVVLVRVWMKQILWSLL